MTAINATASLSPGLVFMGGPESLFDLMQNLLDAEQIDPAVRNVALMALVAYHGATLSNDKLSAVHAINKIHKDALLLLDYLWGIDSGVNGVYTMPVDNPGAPQLHEIAAQVATTRAARGYAALKVTS
jgi:hypothetical protein